MSDETTPYFVCPNPTCRHVFPTAENLVEMYNTMAVKLSWDFEPAPHVTAAWMVPYCPFCRTDL